MALIGGEEQPGASLDQVLGPAFAIQEAKSEGPLPIRITGDGCEQEQVGGALLVLLGSVTHVVGLSEHEQRIHPPLKGGTCGPAEALGRIRRDPESLG